MIDNPLISIITPYFNRYELMEQTMESVKNQSFPRWEHLVIDDGSTDDSYLMIKKYIKQDDRIKLFKREQNPKGASTCRNIGLENASGEYVIFLDSDDLLDKECLKTRYSVMKRNPSLDFSVFMMQFFNEHPGDSKTLFYYNHGPDHIFNSLLRGSQWGITCPIWRKEAIDKIGYFIEGLLILEDWELHLRALINGLEFKKYEDIIDCYCRQERRNNLTEQYFTTEFLISRVDLFPHVHSQLESNNKLGKYRYPLAGKFLQLAGMFNEKGMISYRNETWVRCKELGIISRVTWVVGICYLFVRRILRGSDNSLRNRIARKIFSLFVPKYVIWSY